MSAHPGRRAARPGGTAARVVAAAAVLLVAALVTLSPAGAASTPPLGTPRVQQLTPRVLQLTPRIVTLTPRVVSVAPKQTRTTFDVGSDILFAFDRSDLSPEARSVLAGVITRLRHDKPGTITISGYTDSIGSMSFNLGLSRRRADAVRTYLEHTVGNSRLQYRARGFGEADPVAPNTVDGHDNPAGRQRNRRVTISYAGG